MIISILLYSIQIILPLFGILIIYVCFRSIFASLSTNKPLIVLINKMTGEKIPIIYWENSLGRDKHCDIVIQSPTVSRDHAVLFRREEGWKIVDTNSTGGILLNREPVRGSVTVHIGDVIQIGGIDFELHKANILDTVRHTRIGSKKSKSYSNFSILLIMTIFHLLVYIQSFFNFESFNFEPLIFFGCIIGFYWIYFLFSTYILKRINFELETMGLFLSSIGMINLYTIDAREAYVQMFSLIIGIVFFEFIIIILKNPDFSMKFRPYVAVFAIILLIINLVFGKFRNGAQNWVTVGQFSFQPSEIVKVAFIFFGSSTLQGIQTTKNLTGFIAFSIICMGALFLMGDFGSACVFFVTFILIAFMRSGSIRTVFLTCSAAFLGFLFILKFKPYIVSRFSAWRHVWEHVNDIGYQQTRVLTYSASGGMFGLGIGKGCLRGIFAASSDLVFGMISEEWGGILALTILTSIVVLGIYSKRASVRSHSAFYSISSCCASGMLIFQTMLNVFGVIDIFPLTGVTLPFISLGGSSMISVWGLLSFIKALDERTYSKRYKH